MGHAVIALGGNAILKAGEEANMENQMANLKRLSADLVSLLDRYETLIITHGNGPQVGDILLQNELSRQDIPPMPLDVCVAESQGQIAYFIQLALRNALAEVNVQCDIASMLTIVAVDEDIGALASTKPIGPYYHRTEVERLKVEKGWSFIEDRVRGGYRRVVHSPMPKEVLGIDVIRRLLTSITGRKLVIIMGGGGGIPVQNIEGRYFGIEAVVDKDHTSSLIACETGADMLIMLTDIDAVYVDYKGRESRPLLRTDPEELEKLLAKGQFPPGSMGPKVSAAIRFVRCQGGEVKITNAEGLPGTLAGKRGTTVVRER